MVEQGEETGRSYSVRFLIIAFLVLGGMPLGIFAILYWANTELWFTIAWASIIAWYFIGYVLLHKLFPYSAP